MLLFTVLVSFEGFLIVRHKSSLKSLNKMLSEKEMSEHSLCNQIASLNKQIENVENECRVFKEKLSKSESSKLSLLKLLAEIYMENEAHVSNNLVDIKKDILKEIENQGCEFVDYQSSPSSYMVYNSDYNDDVISQLALRKIGTTDCIIRGIIFLKHN